VVNTETRVEKIPHLTGRKNKKVYSKVYINGKSRQVHLLVALAFIPNPNNYPIVNHIDGYGIPLDNNVYNLEWSTFAKNNKHAYDTGLKQSVKGEAHPFNKFPESTIRQVCEDFVIGYTPIDLVEKYGMSIGLLRGIFYGLKWKHVTKDYNIRKKYTYSKNYTTDMKMISAEMIKAGYRNIEIVKHLGLPINTNTREFVSHMRNIVRREEGSTTIESTLDKSGSE
jgi:hypothetical protein